jgi:hypothetical protein
MMGTFSITFHAAELVPLTSWLVADFKERVAASAALGCESKSDWVSVVAVLRALRVASPTVAAPRRIHTSALMATSATDIDAIRLNNTESTCQV